MPTTLVAHEQPISRIFSNDYVFRIPPYQRPYAWTTQQALELFDDLSDFMTSRPGKVEDMPPYFLGSMVLIKSADNDPNADVVDGQQRLTTLVLLLSAIRANVAAQSRSDITQLIYERGSQIHGTQDRYRLTLRERDREFFQRYVQREEGFSELLQLPDPLSDSQRNIRENAKQLHERLIKIGEEERLRLAQFIVTRTYLVVVATPDLLSAYRIFSVLNTRGLDLSATDILKAEIVGATPQDQRDAYNKKWEDIEEDLGREAFGELFSHIRMVYRKAKPHGTLIAEFKEHVLKDMKPVHFIDDVLMRMAIVYQELTDSAYLSAERAEEVNERLKWLNRLEFNDWLPPSLAFSVRYKNQPKLMASFFGDLERLAYVLLITKAGINDRIDRFSKLTKAIEGAEDLFASKSPLQLTPSEQYSAYRVLSGPIYDTLSARARTAILLRLDSLMSGGGASYDYDTITVEHVLPQNPPPTSTWIKWFPDPAARVGWVHTLGNLALLTRKKNSAAGNYEFEKKKEAYFSREGISPFVLTTQVLNHLTWTPEIIADRQNQLLSVLESHWRLQDRKVDPVVAKIISAVGLDGETWRDDVREGLRRLGGTAPLQKLYSEVESIRRAGGRSIPTDFGAAVRRTLEDHSSDSSQYKGGVDVFFMPQGKGAGVWALRTFD